MPDSLHEDEIIAGIANFLGLPESNVGLIHGHNCTVIVLSQNVTAQQQQQLRARIAQALQNRPGVAQELGMILFAQGTTAV